MKVGILMGSSSDFETVEKSIITLKKFGVEFVVRVLSAHRTPEDTKDFIKESEDSGVKVFIAAAGKAAHLPGVVASYTTLPVIGIPIYSKSTSGLDALYSIVQMPAGIPVATVAIDGAENAALLAIQILATCDESLREKLRSHRSTMRENVLKSDREIQERVNS